jgi:hypothetical protein
MTVPIDPSPEPCGRESLARAPAAARRSVTPAWTGVSAQALRAQAGHGLAEAQRQDDPAERFRTAYLAALRGAAALLALYGRPHRSRSRPTSAWVLLASTAPEFAGWAAFFAERSATRAAVAAGMPNRVDRVVADELVGTTGQFLALVDDEVRSTARVDAAGAPASR